MSLNKGKGKLKGLIFDIQGFSVHDGSGIRDLIFLKGCPLRCFWCDNPEGQSPYPQIMYRRSKCQKSYRCIDVCPDAISKNEDGFITIDRSKCANCTDLKCAKACYNDALRITGYFMTVDEFMARIERDRGFWGSEGGVTFGGGEPMFQHEFLIEVLKRCHESYIHTTMETSGYAPWKYYEEVLKYLDWVFYDIKHMDSEAHKKGTGVSNELILGNIERMASRGNCRIVIRVPVVRGFNDSRENAIAIAEFMRKINLTEINLLPFHKLGESKYEQLGMNYVCKDWKSPSNEKMNELKECFDQYSIKNCYIGSNTPF